MKGNIEQKISNIYVIWHLKNNLAVKGLQYLQKKPSADVLH